MNGISRYDLLQFESFLTAVPTLQAHEGESDGAAVPSLRMGLPPARIEPILAGCGWLRHCRDDAATLPEPEWYGMLSIVGRCDGGEQLAHEFNAPYPTY